MPDSEQPTPKGRRRFLIGYPPGYADMSDEEKKAATLAMADEVHRQLGIGRYAEDGEDGGDTA